MNQFAGLSNFGGMTDEHVGSAGLGGIMGEHHESSMAETLKHLKELWERKFQDLC